MKTPVGLCAGLLAIAGWTANASEQVVVAPRCAPPPSCQPAPTPYLPTTPGQTTIGQPSVTPTTPTTPNEAQPAAPTETSNNEGSFASESGSQGAGYEGTLTAGGSGLASATATGGGAFAANSPNQLASPLILPGLFTASQAESARPANRIFFDYGYFDGFRATITTPNTATGTFQSRIGRGFNLNNFEFGVEKTFLDGRVSAIVRAPILDATDNVTGQPIDGFGDVSAGLKAALLLDQETGSALSVGIDVSAPTGRDQVFVVNQPVDSTTGLPIPSSPGNTQVTSHINPTFLQPYVVGMVNLDGLFVQDFLGVLISTDGRITPFINNDLQVGYQIYHCQDRLLSSITPTVSAQVLIPTSHEGSQPAFLPAASVPATGFTTVNSFNFPDQLFLTEGVQLGLGQRSVLSLGIVEPVVGPKAFTIGATAGLNFFY